jgi:predicted transcriptional regulator
MEIKRNIFESSAKMPAQYEPVAVPFSDKDTDFAKVPGLGKTAHDVVHARSPRVGEQK